MSLSNYTTFSLIHLFSHSPPWLFHTFFSPFKPSPPSNATNYLNCPFPEKTNQKRTPTSLYHYFYLLIITGPQMLPSSYYHEELSVPPCKGPSSTCELGSHPLSPTQTLLYQFSHVNFTSLLERSHQHANILLFLQIFFKRSSPPQLPPHCFHCL